MKPTKTLLLILAGFWTILLIIEKIVSMSSSIKIRNVSLLGRVVYHSFRLFKSALLFSLVIANAFMAITLIEDNK